MIAMNKEYYFSRTPRQIGLENSVEGLYEEKERLLPASLKKEWVVFPSKQTILQHLDDILTPGMFESYPARTSLNATSEDIALACAIYGAVSIAESQRILTYDMIPLLEYAKKYDKPGVIVRQKCLRGFVLGAVNVGRDWMIPADAPYVDYRQKTNETEKKAFDAKPSRTESRKNKDYYLMKTPRQVGYECTEEQLKQDLKNLVPERLQNRWQLFGNLKVILKRLNTIQTPDKYESIIEKKNLLNISALEMAIASTIHCALVVVEARKTLFYNMMTLTEYAHKIGKNPDVVRQKCLRGNVEGATKVGTMWYIPQNTNYDGREV